MEKMESKKLGDVEMCVRIDAEGVNGKAEGVKEKAERAAARAREVLEASGIAEVWKGAGCRVNLVRLGWG